MELKQSGQFELNQLSINNDIDIRLYGLLKDYHSKLFHASMLILEVSDVNNEIKSSCHFCGSDAKQNGRLNENGKFSKSDGDGSIEISISKFIPLCNKCYHTKGV